MTFNPELIAKARKGEIAILNDGSIEEMYLVASQVWPDDHCNNLIKDGNNHWKYYYKNPSFGGWGRDNTTNFPAHSVKDFFMDQPESKESFKKYLDSTEPRTYRVTRQQMKEIWSRVIGAVADRIEKIVEDKFLWYETETELTEPLVREIVGYWDSYPGQRDFLKSIWPEYFHIPEKEAVLCRDFDNQDWHIRVSAGEGGVFANGVFKGGEILYPKQIIPFTKNPPK